MTRAPRVLLLLLVALGAFLAPAAPADAHAALLGATPAPGSVIASSPTEIVVTFSEAVAPVAGRVKVVAPDGEQISGTATATGATLRIPIRKAAKPLGTYLVSYRVISADSHPIGGALTFSVGAPSARPAEPGTTGVHRSVQLATPVARGLGYAGLTLAVGPALFLALLWPRGRSRRGAIRTAYAGLGLIGLATLAGLWIQAPAGSGAPVTDASLTDLRAVLASEYGLAMLARLGLLAVLAGLLPPVLRGAAGRGRGLAVLGLTLTGFVTWPLTGHANAAPLAPVVIAADVVHIAAMAAWLGGLVTLTFFLLRGTHPRVLGVVLPVWSRWAALAVVWLVAGGVVQSVVQVGSVSALWETTYGRLLVAKIGVLALTLGVAALARRMVRRSAGATGGMRRTVGIEVLATVVILGLSAALTQVNPSRVATVDEGAVRDEGVSQTLTSALYTLQFNIYPVQLGENNTIHAFLYTPAGAPLPAAEWTVTSRLLEQDLEPVSQPMLGIVPRHHALGAIAFPLPGTYEIQFTVRVSEIDRATVKTTVSVPLDPSGR